MSIPKVEIRYLDGISALIQRDSRIEILKYAFQPGILTIPIRVPCKPPTELKPNVAVTVEIVSICQPMTFKFGRKAVSFQ